MTGWPGPGERGPASTTGDCKQVSLVFYIISSWFLITTAAPARDAGGIPEHPGQIKEEFTMMGWYGNGMGTFAWLGMGAFWLVLLGLIVWLVVRLLPGSSGGGTTRPAGESALEILDRRLASGEIDVETWQVHRAALLGAQRDKR